MLNGCKGVVFDFNGTLFFDSDKHVLAWNKLSEDLRGVGITREELQTHFYGVPNNRAIEYLLQRECDEAELTKYSERKEQYLKCTLITKEMPPSGGYFFWRRWKQGFERSKCNSPVDYCSPGRAPATP